MSAFPSSLPQPTVKRSTPKARVLTPALPGRDTYANQERDYSGAIQLEFFFNAEQIAIFYTWWKEETLKGGKWFNAYWPALWSGGMVCQFLTEPVFRHVYMGAYRVTAEVSVRGATELMPICLTDPYLTCGPDGDPYWDHVVLMLHFDGADGGTTFIDSSPSARTPSSVSNVTISTAESKFGGSAGLSAEPGGVLEYAYSPDFSYAGNGVFTVEFWIYIDSSNTSQRYFLGNRQTGARGFRFEKSGSIYTLVFSGTGIAELWIATAGAGIPPSTWTHIAVSCDGSTIRGFVNGSQRVSAASSSFFDSSTGAFSIFSATQLWGTNSLVGRLDDIRFTRGIARYTGPFTIPKEAFPDYKASIEPGDVVEVTFSPHKSLDFSIAGDGYGWFHTGVVASVSNNKGELHWGTWGAGTHTNKQVRVYEIDVVMGSQTQISSYNIIDTYPSTLQFMQSDLSGMVTRSGQTLRHYYTLDGQYKTFAYPSANLSNNFSYVKNGDDVYIACGYATSPKQIYKYSFASGGTYLAASAPVDQSIEPVFLLGDYVYAIGKDFSGRKMYRYRADDLSLVSETTIENGHSTGVPSNVVVTNGRAYVSLNDTSNFRARVVVGGGLVNVGGGVPARLHSYVGGACFIDYLGHLLVIGYRSVNLCRVSYHPLGKITEPRTVLALRADEALPRLEFSAPYTSSSADVAPNPAAASTTGSVSFSSAGALFVVDSNSNFVSYTSSKLTPGSGAPAGRRLRWEGHFTISGTPAGTGDNKRFFVIGGGTTDCGFSFRVESGVLRLFAYAYVGSSSTETIGDINAGQQYKLTIAFENSAAMWYVDDVLVRTRASTSPHSGSMWVGPASGGAGGITSLTAKDVVCVVDGVQDSSCQQEKTVTLAGSAVVSEAQAKFGPSSIYVPNTGTLTAHGVIVSNHQDFDFGTQDFTIECWAYRLANTYTGYLFWYAENNGEFSARVTTGGTVTLQYRSSGGAQTVTTAAVFPLNEWVFVTIQRRGANLEFALNGVVQTTTAITGGAASTVNLNGDFFIGRTNAHGAQTWNGYVDEFWVTRGVAKFGPGNFDLPADTYCDPGS